MCLKWFKSANHFLTALYGKWDSESHSYINYIFPAYSHSVILSLGSAVNINGGKRIFVKREACSVVKHKKMVDNLCKIWYDKKGIVLLESRNFVVFAVLFDLL